MEPNTQNQPSLVSKMEVGLQGKIRTPLLPGETIVKQGIGTWKVGKIKVVNVDVFLTNQRLIFQDNLKSAAIGYAAAAVGAGSVGGIGAAFAGGGGALSATLTKQGGGAIPLQDIGSVTTERYKALGFIPGRYPMLVFTVKSLDQPIKILFRNYQEWLAQISQALQPHKA